MHSWKTCRSGWPQAVTSLTGGRGVLLLNYLKQENGGELQWAFVCFLVNMSELKNDNSKATLVPFSS